MRVVNYDELYYLINEKNEVAEQMLFKAVQNYLEWLCTMKANDFLRREDILSYGWLGYIEAFASYDPTNRVTFKSFMQHCIMRRLIDVQRKRNKGSLKGHMSSLLMSDQKVQYAVEAKTTFRINDVRLLFESYWEELTSTQQQILTLYIEGVELKDIARQCNLSEPSIYRQIRQLRQQLTKQMTIVVE